MIVTLIELEKDRPRKVTFRLKEHWNPKVNSHNVTKAIDQGFADFVRATSGNFKTEIRYEEVKP